MNIFELISNIVSLFSTIFQFLGNIQADDLKTILIFIVIILLIALIIICNLFIKKNRYIKFTEFLFENDIHRFTLLPKLRMFIESKKLKNELHLLSLDITCNIKRNENFADEEIADLHTMYTLEIENRNLPKVFNFVFGNDYALGKPSILYSIDNGSKAQPLFNQKKQPTYVRGSIGHTTIKFNKENLPKRKFKLEIFITYKESFNFSESKTDTLILLPILYGKKIDKISWNVNFIGFDKIPKFYLSSNSISRIKKSYSISSAGSETKNEKYSKRIEFEDINTKKECAYYARIGVEENMTP